MTKSKFEKIKELLFSPDSELFYLAEDIIKSDKQFCEQNKIIQIYRGIGKSRKTISVLFLTDEPGIFSTTFKKIEDLLFDKDD